MKKSVLYIITTIVLFLIGFFIARNNSEEIKTVKHTQIILGTVVDIQVRDEDEQKAEDAIAKAFAEVKRIDDLFTTYSEESAVWKLNNSADSIISVDPEIYSLIVLCDSITKISDGCFDVSLDNLTKDWGFDSDNPHLPSESCLLYTSDAADERSSVDLGDRRILKKKRKEERHVSGVTNHNIDERRRNNI